MAARFASALHVEYAPRPQPCTADIGTSPSQPAGPASWHMQPPSCLCPSPPPPLPPPAGLYRALTLAAQDNLLTDAFYFIPSLAGPASVVDQRSVRACACAAVALGAPLTPLCSCALALPGAATGQQAQRCCALSGVSGGSAARRRPRAPAQPDGRSPAPRVKGPHQTAAMRALALPSSSDGYTLVTHPSVQAAAWPRPACLDTEACLGCSDRDAYQGCMCTDVCLGALGHRRMPGHAWTNKRVPRRAQTHSCVPGRACANEHV